MFKKILQYKKMIGEAISLSRQNHENLQKLLIMLNEVSDNAERQLSERTNEINKRTNELGAQVEQQLNERTNELGARVEQQLNERTNELGVRVEQQLNERTNELGIRLEQQLNARTNELGARVEQQLGERTHELGVRGGQLTQASLDEIRDLRNRLEKHDIELKLQNEITAVNTAAFAEYRNINTGKDVVLVATGPTIEKYVPIKGAVHIGVNKACQYKNIPLDYYFIQDARKTVNEKGSRLSYEDDVIALKCKKFFGMLSTTPNGFSEPSESLLVKANATRYCGFGFPSETIYHDIRFHPLADFSTITFAALNFVFFTNPKRVYLVGCDVSFSESFIHNNGKEGVKFWRVHLNRWTIGYCEIKKFVQRWYPETEIISINPVNLKGIFTDVYTNDRGEIIERTQDDLEERDISEQGIKLFIDEFIEKILLKMVHEEASCNKCDKKVFSLVRGLSDDVPNCIEIKCNECGFQFLFPEV